VSRSDRHGSPWDPQALGKEPHQLFISGTINGRGRKPDSHSITVHSHDFAARSSRDDMHG